MAVMALLLPARLWAVQATLLADTHVSAAQPAVNSGGLSNVNVGGGYTGLMQFNLGVLPAGTTGAQVARATLRIYCNRADTPGTVSLLPVYGSWTELGVTYATLPVLGTAAGTAEVSAANGFITFDVTAMVQGWVNAPGSNFGLALSSATAVVQFDSKENDQTAHPADLEIALAPGSGSAVEVGGAGATGATGATGVTGLTGATGATGVPGAPGSAGLNGVAGATGATGPAGPAGAGLVNYRGAYSSTVNYANGDVIEFGGSTYISQTAGNHGNTPGISTAWGLLASGGVAGFTGPAGATGATGQQGPAGFGVQGITGFTGSTGATGATGSAGLVYQGAYDSTMNYGPGDVVVWNGSSFVSLIASNHGNTPGLVPGTWGSLTQQGPTGVTGSTGAAGPSGATGALGPVGPPGEKGDQGAQGIAGQAGAQGLAGAIGPTGLQGPMGPAGAAGPVGMSFQGSYSPAVNYSVGQGVMWQGSGWVSLLDGNHGNTPDQSPNAWAMFAAPGSTGAMGATGMGLNGATGATGTNGADGANGATGATGSTGSAGLTYQGAYLSSTNYALGDVVVWNGSSYASLLSSNRGNTPDAVPSAWGVLAVQGAAGPAGPMGSVGATGSAGPVGMMGSAGPQGPQGVPGIAGSAGTAGATGPVGATGAQGATGGTGVPGPAGAQGIAGATGSTGLQGPVGSAGPAGPIGMSFQGPYSSTANYSAGQGVLWLGAGWVSLVNGNQGNTPDQSPAAWAMFAAQGATGNTGAAGIGFAGATGATGAAGSAGATGPAGATGSTGATGLIFSGTYSTATGYSVGSAVSFNGSSYVSLVNNNHGQQPDISPAYWGVLAAAGVAGPVGPAGVVGATGSTGSNGAAGAVGPAGSTGATGAQGAIGLDFRSAWSASTPYVTNDAVTFAGSTYLALSSNNNQEPDQYPQVWAVLAEAGGVGPTGVAGAAGSAATVSVGTVTTLAAGAQATVTNAGSSTAAVLNFGIPQGPAGTGGSSPSTQPQMMAMYHAVNYNYAYYATNSPNSSATETAPVLAWVPRACTASRLDVYSQQSGAIRVTLRIGSASLLNSTVLTCSPASNGSCSITGSVAVAAGQFMDLYIQFASATTAGVWTSVECDP